MTDEERKHYKKVLDAADHVLFLDEFAHSMDEYNTFVDYYTQADEEELKQYIEVVKCFLEILETAQDKKKKRQLAEIEEQIKELLIEYQKLGGNCGIFENVIDNF